MCKRIFTNPENDTFDWSLYENGYNGKNLVKNTKLSVNSNDKIVVYSHEHYAKELLAKYLGDNSVVPMPKDLIQGNVMKVIDIKPYTKTSIIVDTTGGGSFVVDLNKEKELVKSYEIDSPETFAEMLRENRECVEQVMSSNPYVKVLDNRVSLWAGHLDEMAAQLEEQLHAKVPNTYFTATIVDINNGGYIVDIGGLKCFMPGSMAAAGIITDFQSLVGKSLRVMVVNYIPERGYVVSYKKYLSTIMPKLVMEQLEVDMRVSVRVTGLSKNGIFVQFNDKDGEPTFSGLIYRDNMSPSMEEMFDEGDVYTIGDILNAYIHSINVEDGKVRIVLGDTTLAELEKFGKAKPAGKKRKEKTNE